MGAKKQAEDRTAFEIKEVLGAPLAIELMVAAQAMADVIKKLPPEAQPPALTLALGVISAVQRTLVEFVEALPGLSPEMRAKEVRKTATRLRRLVKNPPPNSPLPDFAPAFNFVIAEVGKAVATLGSLPPTIPHYITPQLVDGQATMMKKYLTKQVLQ
jgi:hypothetical protein